MGSATNILFKDAYDRMGIPLERIEPWEIPLTDLQEEVSVRPESSRYLLTLTYYMRTGILDC